MFMGKIIIVLAIIAAGAWFFIGNNKNTSSAEKQTAVSVKSKKLPPAKDSEFNPVPGSLSEQLVLFAKSQDFKNISLINNFYRMRDNAENNAETSKFLKKHEALLQRCRSLAEYTTLGAKLSGSPQQLMPYTGYFDSLFTLLCFSAEYQSKYGDKKQGVEDFHCALRLLKTFCSESPNIIHFYTAIRHHNNFLKILHRSNISEENRQKLLSEVLDRQQAINMLKLALEGETNSVLYLRQWADSMPELIKGGADREWLDWVSKLKTIPADRLKKLCGDYNNIIVTAFTENTCEELAKFNIGTAAENNILEYHYNSLKTGITRTSKAVK